MGLHKILKYAVLALSIIGIIFALMIITGSNAMIDNILYVAYAALLIIILLVLIYVFKGLFSGNVKKTLVSVGLFVAIFIIAYALTGGDTMEYFYNDKLATEGESHMVGTGLVAFYIFAILAVLSMVYTGVKKMTN